MDVNELLDLDATAIADTIAAGEVHAVEVVEAALARIEARNPVLNAVVATRAASSPIACRQPTPS
jgi:Asp-tRNA(Asn)/Glu-tRNA(Gln) amidotransferase A subunit family amidase